MKNFLSILLVILLAGVVYYYFTNDEVEVETPTEVTETEVAVEEDSDTSMYSDIIGCYEARTNDDVYTMIIKEVSDNGYVSGLLSFDNYEKDSSSGPFEGTYNGEYLYADYTFESEGMESVMEVAFQRVDEDFVRGYGEVTEDGISFVNRDLVMYESDRLSRFNSRDCSEI